MANFAQILSHPTPTLPQDVEQFTKDVLVLSFWANHGKEFPTWAHAMQIVGSFTPNSAAAERVFSMLKLMFGDTQMSALADMIQAALMLRYNKRKVGCMVGWRGCCLA